MFTPSPHQSAVLQDVLKWAKTPSAPQWRLLAGPAGTGKTSLAALIAQEIPGTLFAAFTGKAASVLRSKGCDGAMTLHQLMYRPNEEQLASGKYATSFSPREDSAITNAPLVILDECSMVSTAMATDLLSYGTKVLVLGDPFQLPPVSGEGHFTRGTPNWMLTEVHRQAAESGILRLATNIREGRGIGDPISYGPECAIISLEQAAENEPELLDWRDVIIVGTHRWRHHFNRICRERAGYFEQFPRATDELVCLQNDHRRGLLNGSRWRVESHARQVSEDSVSIHIRSSDHGAELLADCWTYDFLGQEDKFDGAPWSMRAKRARFTYGYAMTCHKMQGSEEERVLLLDESDVFREHSSRWLYTAATRASKQLVMVKR